MNRDSVRAGANQCFSLGRLTLASAEPDTHRVITELMLSDPRDLVRLRDATRRLLALAQQPAVRAISAGTVIDAQGTLTSTLDSAAAINAWLMRGRGYRSQGSRNRRPASV